MTMPEIKKYDRTDDEIRKIDHEVWSRGLVRLDCIVDLLDVYIDRARHYECGGQLEVALKARNEIAGYLWLIRHHDSWGHEDFAPRKVRHDPKHAPKTVTYYGQGAGDPIKPTPRPCIPYHDDHLQPYSFDLPEREWPDEVKRAAAEWKKEQAAVNPATADSDPHKEGRDKVLAALKSVTKAYGKAQSEGQEQAVDILRKIGKAGKLSQLEPKRFRAVIRACKLAAAKAKKVPA
jgi:hypothetical protein